MDREEAKKVFKKLAASYPNWKVDRDIAENWIEELEQADREHVIANMKEYIRESKYPPSLSEIIKPNHRIEAEREIEKTRAFIEQQKERDKAPPVPPPWVREGLTKEDWMRKVIAERKTQ